MTVTVYVPPLPLQDSVEVWDAPRTMLEGVRVQVSPVTGEIEEVSATVPVNPWTGATVMVEVPAVPALAVTLVGAAVTVKSRIVTVTVAVWVSEPLVPVTVTV